MRYMLASRRLVTLMIVGMNLTACGGDADEAANTNSNTLAVTTPTSVSTDASSPMSKATAVASSAIVDERTATTNDEDGEAPAPDVTLVAEASNDAFGKDIPPGPAPTVPPAPPSDFDRDGDGMYTIEEFEEAIRYRYEEYEWPSNYQLDLGKAIEAMSFPEGSRHEAPGEYTFLGLYHECAWELALLDAVPVNDQEAIDESLYQLVEFGQNKNPLSHDENGKAFKRDMWDRAALGDVAPLQQWVDNNCDRMRPYFITLGSETPAAMRNHGHDPGSTKA